MKKEDTIGLFPAPLQVTPFYEECLEEWDGRSWILLTPFLWRPDEEDGVAVPAGFITDFASVPRVFWRLYPPVAGKYAPAAVLHDYLYAKGMRDRKACDEVLSAAMKDLSVGWTTRSAIYRAVRIGGGKPWSKHRKTGHLVRRITESGDVYV